MIKQCSNYKEMKLEIYMNNNINGKIEALKKIVIIDPDNEYGEVAKMLGVELITIEPDSETQINSFEINNINKIQSLKKKAQKLLKEKKVKEGAIYEKES